MALPIIIDTDPGIDDAVAIALAAASPELDILGITAVAGNVGIEKTAANAAALADLFQLDVPIGKGAAGPLWRTDRMSARTVHGEDGLGGYQLPTSHRALLPAVPLMAELIVESPGPVTIVGIGPVTNLATLVIQYPEVAAQVERFVLMGGGTGRQTGNVRAGAEFNMYFDPDAATRLYEFGVPITMVGLNVTERALVGWQHLEQLSESGGPVAHLIRELMGTYRSQPTAEGMAQHDSLALAAVIAPDLIKTKHLPVAVENAGRLTAGMTLVDWRNDSPAQPNCDVAIDLDVERFRELLDERLTKLDSWLLKN